MKSVKDECVNECQIGNVEDKLKWKIGGIDWMTFFIKRDLVR